LEELAELIEERDAAAAQVAAGEAAERNAVSLVASLVAQAVERAGGIAKVVEAVIAAEILTSASPECAAVNARIQGLNASAAADRERFAKLSAAGLPGSALGEILAARRAAREAEIQAARAELSDTHRQAARDLARAAVEGSEHDRARLAALARNCPDAFVLGFSAELEAAAFDEAARAQLVRELATVA